ncbi:MAG: hypothetical protein QOD97_3495 [Mycobacterium sp.]|jgi:hypothetical protein|nr:hypothetical protein [Mycobacterium sp.]
MSCRRIGPRGSFRPLVWISGRTSLLADLRRILRADLQQRVQKVLGVNLGALVAFHIHMALGTDLP